LGLAAGAIHCLLLSAQNPDLLSWVAANRDGNCSKTIGLQSPEACFARVAWLGETFQEGADKLADLVANSAERLKPRAIVTLDRGWVIKRPVNSDCPSREDRASLSRGCEDRDHAIEGLAEEFIYGLRTSGPRVDAHL